VTCPTRHPGRPAEEILREEVAHLVRDVSTLQRELTALALSVQLLTGRVAAVEGEKKIAKAASTP
jgi:hypothetical protein